MLLSNTSLASLSGGNESFSILLNTNPPPLSAELLAYLPNAQQPNGVEPRVGFNGANIGEGAGNGMDEVVALSFAFPSFESVQSASLTLDITSFGTDTDALLFADNNSVRGDGLPGTKFYGNGVLRQVQSGTRRSVTIDLSSVDTKNQSFGPSGPSEDLRSLLLDGDLNFVYADDAIIHSARLNIVGVPITELVGTDGANVLVGTSKKEILKGLGGNDTVAGGGGDDIIYGGDGDDILRGDGNNPSGQGSYGGDDVIYGGNGNDRIGGKGGNDRLYGDSGNDELWGDSGDDLLSGGQGNDTLWGGSGNDRFAISIGDGRDRVRDFAVGSDRIVLTGGLTLGQITKTQHGNDVWLSVNNEVLMVINSVKTNQLTGSAFVLG